MSDIALPIEGGKYKPYIDSLYKLAEVKRQPLENRLETSQSQRKGWLDTNRNLTNLRLTLSRLRGAESVFGDRTGKSANESAMTVNVKRHVQPVDIEINVDKKAAADRFFSEELNNDFVVKSGNYTFTVGEQEVNLTYAGGDLSDFAKNLSSQAPHLLKASVISSSLDKQTFFIESQLTGKEAKLDFKDAARPFAFDTGLITDKIEARYIVESDNKGLKAGSSIDLRSSLSLSTGRYLTVSSLGDTALNLKAGSYLSFDYSTQPRSALQASYPIATENATLAIKEGRLIKERDGGKLFLPEISNEALIYLKIDGELVALPALAPSGQEASVKVDLSNLEGELQSIIMNQSNTLYDVQIKNMTLFIPGDIDFMAVNPASVAQDAEFTLDGVKISRPTNAIDDVVPGLELSVQGKSDKPFIISVKNDAAKANGAIEDFLWAYYVNMGKINTFISTKDNRDVVDELAYLKENEVEQAIAELGLFQGDQTFSQIKSRLGGMMVNPYDVGEMADKKMMLSDIGINTNERGTASTASSRRGYYDIKEPDKLNAALENRWNDVEQLFIGHKKDGAPVATGGLADVMTSFIDNYINNGLIKTKTVTLDGTIKRQEKEITDFNDRLKTMKAKWESDFAKAQGAEQEFNRLQKQIDNTFFNQR